MLGIPGVICLFWPPRAAPFHPPMACQDAQTVRAEDCLVQAVLMSSEDNGLLQALTPIQQGSLSLTDGWPYGIAVGQRRKSQ